MSSISPKSPLGIAMYGLVAVAIAFELAVVWLMLHPQVSSDYRGYYIDMSTTCLNQPISGDYTMGELVSFLPEGADAAKPLKVCGWQGPAGDGTHALGTSSRLRFALPANTGALTLKLEIFALEHEGSTGQTIDVDINGTIVQTITIDAGATEGFDIAVPADVVAAHPGSLELTLNYPDAIKMGPNDSNTRWRSIKLLAAGLIPAA